MGKTEHKNLAQFNEAINKDADEECEKIKIDAETEKREKLASVSEKLELEYQQRIEYETKRLQSESNKKTAEFENRKKIELIEKRNSIQQEIFSKVEKKIKEFVKSQEYKNFVVKSAGNIGKIIRGENLCVFVREEDLSLENEIKVAVGRDCKVEATKDIVLGGLKASTDLQTADDTLENRLKNEQEWFRNNSGLTIV